MLNNFLQLIFEKCRFINNSFSTLSSYWNSFLTTTFFLRSLWNFRKWSLRCRLWYPWTWFWSINAITFLRTIWHSARLASLRNLTVALSKAKEVWSSSKSIVLHRWMSTFQINVRSWKISNFLRTLSTLNSRITLNPKPRRF